MSLSKRTRFEVFKRDGFRCVYCGATPVESPLHVDHVEARANGGSDEMANLVTACQDCNLGKGAVPLGERRKHREIGESDRDQAEQIRAYLEVQKEIAAAKQHVIKTLIDHWCDELAVDYYLRDMGGRLAKLLDEFSVAQIMEAISITGSRFRGDYRNVRDNGSYVSVGQVPYKYFYGILRRFRGERQ